MNSILFTHRIHDSHIQVDLLSMAIQGPTCDKKKIDLMQIFEKSYNESKKDGKSKGISVEVIGKVQEELSKIVSPRQAEHAALILRGWCVGATKQEKYTADVSFKTPNVIYFTHSHLIIYFVFFYRWI